MGFMLLCSRKRFLTNDMSEKPNKKIKLEFQKAYDGDAGNDDFWGQDDITAEEFDLLEIQATQSCNQNGNLQNDTLQTSNLLQKPCSPAEVHASKQLQYELEGRVKLLSLSLEKSTKELNEERLNREQLINERMKQFYEQEVNLKKEIGKMQSILEFKEQEMKSTYSKLQVLKSQLQDKKGIQAELSVNSEFDDFLKRSKFNEQCVRHDNILPVKTHRKYKVSVDMPKGELDGIEIMSSILCTRLSIPPFVNKESVLNYGCLAASSFSSFLTPVSILHLKNEQKCDEILDYYCKFLKNHVDLLKTSASKNDQTTFNNCFPTSTKAKEAFSSITVISYLSDIRYIYSSPRFKSLHQKCNLDCESPSKNMYTQKAELTSSSCVQQDEKTTMSDSTLSLLQSLLILSNPETYPNGYHKNEEMESALSTLLSICLFCPNHFLVLIGEIPCYFLSNPHQSVAGLCSTLNLLTALCTKKSFVSYLVHKESNCTFCLIACFLHTAVAVNPEKFAISFTLVEELLSSVFSIHNYKETKLEVSSCIPKVIQDIIHNLWDFQTDMSEFDLDELSEEAHSCTKDTD